ncbi:deoxyhypusine monooxygenase [Starmerella bacillaris]|uniref:Deoxyhypusine hydroxylase n=1 Tax=Starmerella bacillaris TaxID=1247836 RepID=A0AAV5RR95_STABA|nr:deoxyhypusine monooxygenase [Starmerella bacillaris]
MDALRKSEGSETLVELRQTLLNEDGKTDLANRFRALFHLNTIGKEGNTEAIDIIAAGFNDDSELLKHEMAYVLGQTRQEYAITPLMNVLEDLQQQPMVRHEAAEALGAIGNKRALDILRKFEKDDELEVVRQTCELAIGRIEWENSEAARKERIEKSQFSSIDPAPPMALDTEQDVDKLTNFLNDQSKPLFERYRAMFRLRDIGTTEAVLGLATGFKDPSALFKHEIAYVFGQLCDPASVPALIEVLKDPREEGMVRHEAAEALGSIATEDVLPVLQQFATDDVQVVRDSAIVALDMYNYENSNQLEYAEVKRD